MVPPCCPSSAISGFLNKVNSVVRITLGLLLAGPGLMVVLFTGLLSCCAGLLMVGTFGLPLPLTVFLASLLIYLLLFAGCCRTLTANCRRFNCCPTGSCLFVGNRTSSPRCIALELLPDAWQIPW